MADVAMMKEGRETRPEDGRDTGKINEESRQRRERGSGQERKGRGSDEKEVLKN